MNRTNWEHAGYAVLMQVLIALLTGDWLAGSCFGFAFFLGREHAQYQSLIGYGFKQTFQAFNVLNWSLDAKLDLLFPIIAMAIAFGLYCL